MKEIEMFFNIGEKGTLTYLYPVVMVGDKQLRLDKKLYGIEEAKIFEQGFIVGLTIESPQDFLDLYDERKRQQGLDEDDEAFTDGLEGL